MKNFYELVKKKRRQAEEQNAGMAESKAKKKL